MLIDHLIGKSRQVEQQRCGDVVRQVADDPQPSVLMIRLGTPDPVVGNGGEAAEVDAERIGLDHRHPRPAPCPGRQVPVQLDHRQGATGPEDRVRQGALPGADLAQAVGRPGIDRVNDAVDHRRVDQEVLTESLACDMCHQHASTPALQGCIAQLDIGACAQLAHPLDVGRFELLSAQHVACLFTQHPWIDRRLSTLDHLDQMHAEA